MDNSILLGIVDNTILLLGMGIIYSLIPINHFKNKYIYNLIVGVLISLIVVFIMLTPFSLGEGVILDTRSVLISVAVLFFGPIPGIMVVLTASILRIIQGGSGTLTGVLVILSSGIIGYLFKKYRFDKIKNKKGYRLVELYFLGLIVHIVMLLMFFALPPDIRITIISNISLYVLLIYPIVTVIYGSLMFLQYDIVNNNDELLKSKHNFVVAVEEAPIPMTIHTEDGEVLMVNKTWTDMSGYTIEDIPTIFDWVKKAYSVDDFDQAVINIRKLFDSTEKIHEGEIKVNTKCGVTKTWDFYSSPLGTLHNGKKSVLSVATDITERRKLEKKLTRLSFHDELTGLYNRRFYDEELKRLNTKRNYPLTLLMGDVNGLKIINDSFGHTVGDTLLKTTANVLKQVCRKDDIIVRLGGDEFMIILPKTNLSQTDKLATRIKDELFINKIKAVGISISFGYASLTEENPSIEKVFISAENAMYQNKLLESPSIRGFAIEIILNTIFEIDPTIKVHSENVANYATQIALAMDLPLSDILEIKTAALLHDIGKIVTPVSILEKKGKLTSDEYEEIKKHPEKGYRILSSGPSMDNIAKYCLSHHERYDGAGYPSGLSKEEIPIQSRIIALADSYDAMISKRTYKDALTKKEAIEEIKRNIGTQFDPTIANIFIEKVLQKAKK